MRHPLAACSCLVVVASASAQEAASATASVTVTVAPAGDQVVLFDGKDTSAWRGYGQKGFPEQGWTVVDGALVHAKGGGGGDLVTRRQFRNFELTLQWRVGEKANSGILYRVAETENPSYYTGPEYQVIDDGGGVGAHSAGALYDLAAPASKATKPAGEWNDARIVVVGERIEHWLNGQRVVAVDCASPDFQARFAKSKFAPWKGFNEHRRGHLCLQDHGDEVAYRNITVRELPPEPARRGEVTMLFDGSTLGAFGAHLPEGKQLADVWSIVDGVMVCAGKPAGYIYTKAKYESFVLELQWRFDPKKGGGNSGVLLRMTGEHKVWPRSIEAQLHAGNAGDFWNIGEFPMQVDAARTKGRNTKKLRANEKPLGEWNDYRITVDGPWVRLEVNGEVLNEAWGCEVIPGHICLQSEGAEIQFRDIRLTSLK